jgi:hypothetical protein
MMGGAFSMRMSEHSFPRWACAASLIMHPCVFYSALCDSFARRSSHRLAISLLHSKFGPRLNLVHCLTINGLSTATTSTSITPSIHGIDHIQVLKFGLNSPYKTDELRTSYQCTCITRYNAQLSQDATI